jgi:hypothetical protein
VYEERGVKNLHPAELKYCACDGREKRKLKHKTTLFHRKTTTENFLLGAALKIDYSFHVSKIKLLVMCTQSCEGGGRRVKLDRETNFSSASLTTLRYKFLW